MFFSMLPFMIVWKMFAKSINLTYNNNVFGPEYELYRLKIYFH